MMYSRESRIKRYDEKDDSSYWPLRQLFAKLDSLIGHENVVSNKSKQYYLKTLISLYFDMPEYFKNNTESSEEVGYELLRSFKDSLNGAAYGEVELFRQCFYEVCNTFDFIISSNSLSMIVAISS